MSSESHFDAKIRVVGNSKVITLPYETVEKLALKEDQIIEVRIRKPKK